MRPAAVEEQIGDQLVRAEKIRADIMSGAYVHHFLFDPRAKRLLSQKDQYIDNEQIFYNRRYAKKASGTKLCHMFFLFVLILTLCKLLFNTPKITV